MLILIALIVVAIMLIISVGWWRKDINAYEDRINKLLLSNWYLDDDNKNLKIEIKRLRKLIKEQKI